MKLISESDFRSGSRNLSHPQQSFSGRCWLKGTRVDLAECWANIGQVHAITPSRFYEENKPGAERELGKEECTHGNWTKKAEDKKNYLPSNWTRPGWTGVKSLQLWSRPAWNIQQYHNSVRPFGPQVYVYPSSLYSTWESFLTPFKRNSHVFNVRIPPQAASIPARTDCPKRRKRWFYTIDYSWFIVQSLAPPYILQFSGGATKLVIGRPKVRLLLGALGFLRSFSESSSYRKICTSIPHCTESGLKRSTYS